MEPERKLSGEGILALPTIIQLWLENEWKKAKIAELDYIYSSKPARVVGSDLLGKTIKHGFNLFDDLSKKLPTSDPYKGFEEGRESRKNSPKLSKDKLLKKHRFGGPLGLFR